MIRNYRLANFKAVKEGMELLEFRDLTIFAGANSSGKSTIIQSILLLMQTIANRENVALQLNGELVTLGQVEDVWHSGTLVDQQNATPILIEMLLRDIYDSTKYCYIRVELLPTSATQVALLKGYFAIGIGTNYERFSDQLSVVWRDDGYVVDAISDDLETQIRRELYTYGMTEISPLQDAKVSVEYFYPRWIEIEALTLNRDIDWPAMLTDPLTIPLDQTDIHLAIPANYWIALLRSAANLQITGLETTTFFGFGKKQRAVTTFREYREWFGKLSSTQSLTLHELLVKQLPNIVKSVREPYNPEFLRMVKANLDTIFTRSIRYLSANRHPPTMLFSPDANSLWSEVGVTGSNVGSALREHAARRIRFWHPFEHQINEGFLSEALILWLQFFELVDRVEAEDRGKLGTMLKIYASGMEKELDLTSVGFGTSQVLPIIAQGLLTPSNAVFIVEQPEVHLHPRVQSQLADFFLALARVGVQCIIETHSEHIINRLRLRIVEDEGTEVLKRVQIYFAERIGTESQFRKVESNEYGAISQWPEGFFDQGENENLRIARLASKKRRSKG